MTKITWQKKSVICTMYLNTFSEIGYWEKGGGLLVIQAFQKSWSMNKLEPHNKSLNGGWFCSFKLHHVGLSTQGGQTTLHGIAFSVNVSLLNYCMPIFLVFTKFVRDIKKRNHKFSNSPIYEFKVLHKGHSLLKSLLVV